MRRRVLLLVAVLVVAGAAASGAFGAAASTQGPPVVARQDTTENTTTPVRHRNPESVFERGDRAAESSHLADRMSRLLGASTVQLSQGEYEAARSLVGEEYDAALEKYINVAGDTDREETTGRFERAQRQQRKFVDTVVKYNRTRAAYREAREAGNDTRARLLARRMERLAARVNATGTGLNRTYARIAASADVDLDAQRNMVMTVRRVIVAQQRDVRQREFVRTTLRVVRATERIAFVDPLELTGRLRTENGTAVANRSVTLSIGERLLERRTNATGGFELTYRPVLLPTDADVVTVEYRPDNRSIYLGTKRSVPVTVDSVTPDLAVGDISDRVGYGEPVDASGQVTVDGRPVPNVPVVLRIDETTIARTTTDANGSYQLGDSLPARVAAGSRSATVDVALTERAIEGVDRPVAVTVTRTATEIAVSANASADSVLVSGTLETAAGQPVANQSVDLRVEGTLVASVTTNAEGRFATTLAAPAGAVDRVRVLAVYDDPATNLEPSRARAVAPLPAVPSGEEGLFPIAGLSRASVLGIAAALLGLLALGGAVYARRRGGSEPTQAPDAAGARPSEDSPHSPGDTLLERATQHQATGAGREAVEAAYGAARQTLAVDGVPATGTHWEFYRAAHAADLDGATVEALETLTATYERAAFSDRPVEPEDTDAALAAARSIVAAAE